ncbi:hypothetical protein KAFR_0F03510 [Kazachstania africana CBS 2517]|uniref:Mannosyl-oligosaccharide glucosidase n=1 Tax=Kazachstania africana (strain ATCC 22294 / BCRC 22015 / CBS 2517 / CECT 1963 / NBRC 1671 / NRRL Y-8276) TaxID=1071382 RepID=H2AX47_KAZAF|nr:hypothetical protein KAFR_0F03510 [Kazachstania africana CBS 2517]CCF58947.1 hypothetical protein KAFR_0F03510 [Kazachstania africana CBS 2517]
MIALLGTLWAFLSIVRAFNAEEQQTFNHAKSFEEYTNQSLLWAPYRSNSYFGIRPRNIDNTPFIFGLMWFESTKLDSLTRLRHYANIDDHLEKFSWEVYDPRLGGMQTIIDTENNVNLTIYFTKSHDGKNWVARVHGEAIDETLPSASSVVLYMNQNVGADVNSISRLDEMPSTDLNKLEFAGFSTELGDYKVLIRDNYGKYFSNDSVPNMEVVPGCDSSKTKHVSLTVPDHEVWRARDVFQSILADSIQSAIAEVGETNVNQAYNPSFLTLRNIHNFPPGNFHYIQKTFSSTESFEFDVIYNSMDSKENIRGQNEVNKLIDDSLNEVRIKFDKKFNINSKDEEKHKFALETLSNLLGGIGYFHGNQIIDRATVFDEDQFEQIKLENGEEEGPFSLFSTVPSRGFFPRGFYWDAGFEILQVMEYDFDLAFELISSWFSMIDDDGWVAREVILGPEARSRVPPEFVVQSPNIANPPTLLLAFSEMLTRAIENFDSLKFENSDLSSESHYSFHSSTSQLKTHPHLLTSYGEKIYPKLLKHFNWFTESQKGSLEDYYEVLEDQDMLDQIHKDTIYHWVGRTVTHCLPSGLDDYPRAQPPDTAELNVDTLSWVGVMARSMKKIAHVLKLEDDESKFEKIEQEVIENLDLLHWSEEHGCYCDVTLDDEYEDDIQLVCHEGYVSLMPFALKLIPNDPKKLNKLVSLMSDPEKIFSDYGLLSLSKQDEYFGKDENYWRGPIWMNINYLCLDALKHYFPEVREHAENLEQSQAGLLYTKLKKNLINNVYNVWKNQGSVYENYSPIDGRGTGSSQFTGWTSLIVNLLGHF